VSEATASVSIRGGDSQGTTLITRESADELCLAPGQQVTVLLKATDVMISTGGDIA
jgi:molybdopterin-binding protein